MSAPVVVTPRRLTRMCWAMALLVTAVFGMVGWALRASEGEMQFGLADQLAMTGLGALIGGTALVFTRARVIAGSDGIRVRNALSEKHLPWAVVRGVRFEEGVSWASLDLHDDDTVAMLAVQANDGERAAEAVRALRELHAAAVQRRA
jgi:hypothetical protein